MYIIYMSKDETTHISVGFPSNGLLSKTISLPQHHAVVSSGLWPSKLVQNWFHRWSHSWRSHGRLLPKPMRNHNWILFFEFSENCWLTFMVTVSYRDTLLRYYLVYIGVVRYQLLQWKLLFCNGIPTRDINFNMSRAKVGALIFLSAGESFCFADFLCRRLCPEISQKGGKFRVAHPRCQMS